MIKDSVYIGMPNMAPEKREQLRHLTDMTDVNVEDVHDKSMLDEVFAPHPLSGNPCSDLFFDLSADPSIKDFIRKELQSSRIIIEKTDNVDEALDFTKSIHESVDKYYERLKGYYSQSKED